MTILALIIIINVITANSKSCWPPHQSWLWSQARFAIGGCNQLHIYSTQLEPICTMLQCVGLSVHRVEKGIYQYPWLCSHPSHPSIPTQTSIETRVGRCCGQFKADDKSHEVLTSCFSRPRASPTPLQAPSSSFVIIEQELRRAYRQVAWDILYSC